MIKSVAKIILGSRYGFFRFKWQKYNEIKRSRINSFKNAKNDAKILLSYKERFNPNIFIETGTYRGNTLDNVKFFFRELFSIELEQKLYKDAVKKFKKDKHIKLFCGDSAVILPKVLANINEPVLFWLDAHYSKADTSYRDVFTPIETELETIFAHKVKNHIIIIDDARCFTGQDGYPTAQAIEKLAKKNEYLYEMKDDKFRLTPICL